MQRTLDVGYRAVHIQNRSVGVGARHGKTVGLEERGKSPVVFFGGTEAFGKLRRGQEPTEVRAGGVHQLRQKMIELALISQGQSYRQAHASSRRDLTYRFGSGNRLRYMTLKNLCAGSPNRGHRQK